MTRAHRRFFFLCSSATSGSSQDPFFGAGAEVISIANSVYIATIGVTIVCGQSLACLVVERRSRRRD